VLDLKFSRALFLVLFLVTACSARRSGDAARPIDEGARCDGLPELASGHGRDRDGIHRKLRERHPELERCFEGALSRDADARGGIDAQMVIDADGSVSSACVQKATLDDGEAADCMLDVLRATDFGRAQAPVTIVYPISFAASR
jgi:hypothetical protein